MNELARDGNGELSTYILAIKMATCNAARK